MWPFDKDVPVAKIMQVHELFFYTLGVMTGREKAQSWDNAQPIGSKSSLPAFAIEFGVIIVVLYGICFLWEEAGKALARFCGLKRGKVDRFAASFVELIYYSLSLFAGYHCFKDCDWIWKSGWDRVMHDGRVQLIPGSKPFMIPPEAKFLYLMESAWVVGGFVRLVTRKAKKDFYEMLFHHVVTFT